MDDQLIGKTIYHPGGPLTDQNQMLGRTSLYKEDGTPLEILGQDQVGVVVQGFTDLAIQAAITKSGWPANPARIFMPPGVYTFTTGVTVNAAGATSTPALTFDGPGALCTTTTSNLTMFTLTNSIVSLTRINFYGVQFHINASGAIGVLLNNAQLCRFDNCTFTGNFATGIKITGTSTYNQITGCHFGDLSRGIYLTGYSDYFTVASCAFNEKVSGSPLNWIQQDVAAGATVGVRIVNNTFYGSQATLHAVKLMHVNNALISDNAFASCDAGGIYVGAGGTSDHNTITNNVFRGTGAADDIYLHGANRCVISNNRFMSPAAGVAADTYANIRVRDPYSSAQGSGCSIMGNVSSATASQVSFMIHADATCTNLSIVGNIGLGGVVAAHASNYLAGNLVA